MNTVAYSAGRVCYPSKIDASRGQARNGLVEAWWPPPLQGREWNTRTVGVVNIVRSALSALIKPTPDTQRDYTAVEGP